MYFCEFTLLDYKFLRYKPSRVAATALYLAFKVRRNCAIWNATMEKNSKLKEEEVKKTVKELCSLIKAVEKSSLQSLKKKYDKWSDCLKQVTE